MRLGDSPRYEAIWLCAWIGALLLAACTPPDIPAPPQPAAQATEAQPSATPTEQEEEAEMEEPTPTSIPFELSSPAFGEGEVIPDRFACTGENLSPELTWGDPPAGTQSLALLFDDPDARGWVHWLVYNLPAEVRGLPEDLPDGDTLPMGGLQGVTSFGDVGYGGPCPPPGAPHTYVFTLYALDSQLDLEAGANANAFKAAIEGHVLDQIQYTGEFSR
jgi:Raf kinase inhibitor-like YbhB/YbcL family protein